MSMMMRHVALEVRIRCLDQPVQQLRLWRRLVDSSEDPEDSLADSVDFDELTFHNMNSSHNAILRHFGNGYITG